MKLFEVADQSNQKVDVKIAQERELRRRETGPIQLKRRDGRPIEEEEQPQSQDSTPQGSPTLGPPQPSVPELVPQPQPSPTQPPLDDNRPQ
jgi:hypothetical protein